MNFIKEVKSYEDICKLINVDPNLKPDVSVYSDRNKDAAVSMFRLWNANEAAWEGKEIDWNDYNQPKYEIWARLNDAAGSGSGFSFNDYNYDNDNSNVSAHICNKVLRDGYVFTVSEVVPVDDVFIIASITLRGESGVVTVGYYDYLLHQKAA